MNYYKIKIGFIAIAGLLSIQSAMAASPATANMQVKTTIAPSCFLDVADINLGTITPNIQGGFAVNNTHIKITCTKGTVYSVIRQSSDTLNNPGETGKMVGKSSSPTSSEDKLDYLVFNEEQEVWPVDQVGITSQGIGQEHSHQITIKVPLNQYIKADTYSDNMTIFINY